MPKSRDATPEEIQLSKELAAQLIAMRKSAGFTSQSSMATEHLPRSTIQTLEQKDGNPSIHVLYRYVRRCGSDLARLFRLFGDEALVKKDCTEEEEILRAVRRIIADKSKRKHFVMALNLHFGAKIRDRKK